MWQFLRLSSLGVIEEAELELGPGFSVITGETGAGKTMVVTALGLLRGERADSGLVRLGADRARVEAAVNVAPGSVVDRLVTEAGGELDDGELVLGRVLSAQGRSRATAGGATVPAAVLTQVARELVAVHGQSDQQRLVLASQQREALDTFGGDAAAEALAAYRAAYSRWRELQRTLADLRDHAGERLREAEMLRHGLEEIGAVEPESGEDEELAAEEARLAHAESLIGAALHAAEALSSDENGAATAVAAAHHQLATAAGHDPRLDALATRVAEAGIELSDIASELQRYGSDIDLDPARLAAVQERRAAITALVRRYGPTLDDVLAWARDAAERLPELDDDDQRIAAIEAELAELEPQVLRRAEELREVRRAAAADLAARVQTELAALSMPSARLEVLVEPSDDLTHHGGDTIEFLFAANSGMAPRPMSKGASGGELSRLMLALEVVLAHEHTVPTLVFDEVDAGIGGKAAVEVGRRLARLARNAQVIAVTHLPQVAAFADHHFVVAKSDDGAITRSSVRRLSDDERVDELARMLAGVDESQAAQEHARELLDLARR
ncbi:DNA repair protein RecN [Aeromicrobium camelliae]|uniref:DNA repair protein RecN n=1 Tax=Aeromicrobium camelliae TaxID=1538144 RepID=A0A3N6W3M4_9ACTN|nr:DNA repair protein RecN [Aeromicrobium camelliae]RQN02136.1 DNA repair protein RecN [Aeromicrobium camelliae]